MNKPNAVVVGYGFAGRCFHAYLVGITADLNLYGVVSGRPEAREEVRSQLGVKAFERFEEALVDLNVDLVVLATPNDLHAPQAIAAMEAGKHVVTDKPMCLNLREADDMIAASRRTGRLLSIFQNRRWDGDYLTVRKVLEEGLIGDPYYIEMAWQQYGPPRTWRGRKAARRRQIRGSGSAHDRSSPPTDSRVPRSGLHPLFLGGVADRGGGPRPLYSEFQQRRRCARCDFVTRHTVKAKMVRIGDKRRTREDRSGSPGEGHGRWRYRRGP